MQPYNSQPNKLTGYLGIYQIQYLIAGGTFGKVFIANLNSKKYAIK